MNKHLIILATHAAPSKLEVDIRNRKGYELLRWKGVPKALLPISSRPALSWTLDQCQDLFRDIYIVANAHNYYYYEHWANSVGLSKANIVNCGISTSPLNDIAFVKRVMGLKSDVVIISCDAFYRHQQSTENIWSLISKHKYVESCPPGILCVSLEAISLTDDYPVIQRPLTAEESITALAEHFGKPVIYDEEKSARDSYYLIDGLTLDSYLNKWISLMDTKTPGHDHVPPNHPITTKAYARVGLMGNPSDGFFGKTISLLISNFWAEITLVPNGSFRPCLLDLGAIGIIHKPAVDPTEFTLLSAVDSRRVATLPDNADRLLYACCKVFYRYCRLMDIPLDTKIGFQLLVDTNIPRQVGLAGSSAIITACWKSLMEFYGLTSKHIPPELQANLVLSVETDELGIAAGLQDRVIQTFGGLVYMNFDKTLMHQIGRGQYISFDTDLLPTLYLAYVAEPDDSGKVHSSVKDLFQRGDKEIVQAMKQFADLAEKARTALEKHDHSTFASLMSMNFDLRRKTYGDDVVGAKNIYMVDAVRRHGGHAKFSGSGGAIVIFMPDSEPIKPLQHELENNGCVFVKLTPMGSQIATCTTD